MLGEELDASGEEDCKRERGEGVEHVDALHVAGFSTLPDAREGARVHFGAMPRPKYVDVWVFLPGLVVEWLDRQAGANFTTRSGYIREVLVRLFKEANPDG